MVISFSKTYSRLYPYSLAVLLKELMPRASLSRVAQKKASFPLRSGRHCPSCSLPVSQDAFVSTKFSHILKFSSIGRLSYFIQNSCRRLWDVFAFIEPPCRNPLQASSMCAFLDGPGERTKASRFLFREL